MGSVDRVASRSLVATMSSEELDEIQRLRAARASGRQGIGLGSNQEDRDIYGSGASRSSYVDSLPTGPDDDDDDDDDDEPENSMRIISPSVRQRVRGHAKRPSHDTPSKVGTPLRGARGSGRLRSTPRHSTTLR